MQLDWSLNDSDREFGLPESRISEKSSLVVCKYFKLSFGEILLAQLEIPKFQHAVTSFNFNRISWKSGQIYWKSIT